MQRSLALRLRGLCVISSGDGPSAFRSTAVALGFLLQVHTGKSGGQVQPVHS
jgi:hypothetical protein